NVSSDNSVTTVHVVLLVEDMHRTPQPARAARVFPKQFRHARICTGAAGKSMGMIAVSGNDVVIVAHGSDRAGHDCFLADVELTKTAVCLSRGVESFLR